MTWRAALDRYRANRRRDAREVGGGVAWLRLASDGCSPPQIVCHAELWTAIDALPEKLRAVIVLASIESHDVREVARLRGIPEGTVKSRSHVLPSSLRSYQRPPRRPERFNYEWHSPTGCRNTVFLFFGATRAGSLR